MILLLKVEDYDRRKGEYYMEEKKSFFGRGIYGKKDAPIKVLDKFIIGAVALIAIFMCTFAMNGGFSITFDSNGGTEVDYQKIKYGELIEEPSDVSKPGYELEKWVTSDDETLAVEWDFDADTVEADMELFAIWIAADIIVKFDLDGGSIDGSESVEDMTVMYGEAYTSLPVPEKEGYTFEGWIYSGNVISDESIVEATGEHVLTALWSQN